MRDIDLQATSFEISGDSEILKVTEAASHWLGDLEYSVYGLHGGVGEAGFHESKDTLPVGLDGARELTKWFESRTISPGTPVEQTLLSTRSEHILEASTQGHGTAQDGIIFYEMRSLEQLLSCEGPLIAPDRPDAAGQIGSGSRRVLAHPVPGITGSIHEVEVIEDQTGLRKVASGTRLKSPTHVHDDLCDLLGFGFMPGHLTGKEGETLLILAWYAKQRMHGVGIHEVGRVVVALLGARFIDQDPAHMAPVFGSMGLAHIMSDHSPKPFVGLPEMTGDRRYRHLLTKQQDHGLHHQGKSSARPGPRHLRLQNTVFLGVGPRHAGHKSDLVLPEVQMPLLLFHRVMDGGNIPTFPIGKLLARLEIQPESEAVGLHVQLAVDLFPCVTDTRCHSKKCVCVRRPSNLPNSHPQSQPFLRLPRAGPSSVPPERLPRRAVRGLGAHSPHQTGSFRPLKTSKCLIH